MPGWLPRAGWIMVLGLLLTFFNDCLIGPAVAQDPGAEAGFETAGEVPVTTDQLLAQRRQRSFLRWMIEASGIFGFLILLTSFIMVALIAMLLLQLRRDNYLPQSLLEQVERLLDDGNYQAAYEAAKGDDSFIGRVLAAGLSRVPRGYDDAVQAMQEVGEEEAMATEHAVGYLSLIGSIAPMLGLLGTVQGMVLSFQVIATATTSPKPYELADGIATALFTTLEGLLVAIPAIVCYQIFRNRLARFVLESGFVADELMRRFQGQRPTAVVPRPVFPPAAMGHTAGGL